MRAKPLAWILLITFLVMQYPVWFKDGGWRHVWGQQNELAGLQTDNEVKSARNQQLRADVDDLADQGRGQAAVDERARYRLGMMRNNEVFVQVVAPK